MKRYTLLTSILGAALLTGCVTDPEDDCCYDDGRAPLPPVGVTTITADEAVILHWIENQEPDLAGYHVYVSDDPRGPYREVGFSRDCEFVHDDLDNGETYYYGVTAVDEYGNESDLNAEIIYDTPRPEGFGLVLYEADGDDEHLSAFDFSRQERVSWEADRADIFYDWAGGVPYLAVPDYGTDIQDAGYRSFDAVTWAPEDGWSPTGFVEAVVGHVYVVWTRDDHYAKVRVIALDADGIELDWAYQVDRANPELRVARPVGSRPRIGSQ